ncbi:MAG: hypothetical protein ACJAT2_002406 [Bacteriovoracaceae bacterium]
MKKTWINKIIILLAGTLTATWSVVNGRPELIVVFALLTSLLHNDNEKNLLENTVFTLGLFSSLILFGYFSIVALFMFELARIMNKGYKSLQENLFSLVPMVTLVLAFFNSQESEMNYLVYYFSISFLLIFVESVRGTRDWPSLVVTLYFISGSNLEVLNEITTWALFLYLVLMILNLFQKRQSFFFNYLCLSVLGLVSLNFSNEKVFSYLIASIAFESISKSKKIRPEFLQCVYIFTLFLFSRDYFGVFKSVENVYPVVLLLLPLFSIRDLVIYKRVDSTSGSDSAKALFAISTYLIGVFAYAY